MQTQNENDTTAQNHAVVMRDLSGLLWCDLVDDRERIAFLESGRAWATGIIAPVMVDEIVKALKCRTAIIDAIGYANGRESEWGERAEECFAILERAVYA